MPNPEAHVDSSRHLARHRPRLRPRRAVGGIALGLAALIAPHAPAAPPAAAPPLDFEPLTLTAFDGRTMTGEIAWMAVPENRADPESATIEIAVARFPATTETPGPPIVFLAGGPGQPGIDSPRGGLFDAFAALRQVADVIAVDQRGTGRSRPALRCAHELRVATDERLTSEKFIDAFRQPLQRCQRRWRRAGVDPAGYTTTESADDLAELRDALGTDRFSLWGASYGTHLALATLRRHPDAIHRVALMGVEGPDHTIKLPRRVHRALRKLSRLVARSDVGDAVPDLIGLAESLVERLGDVPLLTTVADPVTGDPVRVAVDDLLVEVLLVLALGDREDMARLPVQLVDLDKGVVSARVALTSLAIRRHGVETLMRWTMDCASGVSPPRERKVERQAGRFVIGHTANLPIPDVCDVVDVPDLGPPFRAPIRSDVPTLFVSGDLDGRTPPANAREVARGFSNATHVLLRGGSHDDLFTSEPGLVAALVEFFRGDPVTEPTIHLEDIDFEPVGPQS